MSHLFTKIACVSAGLVIAALAAGSAIAAKPIAGSKPQPAKQSLSVKQKNELAAAMARSKQKAAPKTMAKAEATMEVSGGVTIIEVPEDLYNYLTATPDAHGKMRVRDTNAAGHSNAAAVEATHEN